MKQVNVNALSQLKKQVEKFIVHFKAASTLIFRLSQRMLVKTKWALKTLGSVR